MAQKVPSWGGDFAAAVITGGSSGIGAEYLRQLLQMGGLGWVGNLSRRSPGDFSGKVEHFPCDLADAAALQRQGEAVVERLEGLPRPGKVLLINNSGFGSHGEFPHPNLAWHQRMLAVNVAAPVHLTGLLLPLLRKRGGAVVNVASTAAFQPTPHMATYGATKAFLLHWSLGLAEDLRGTGVQVLAVCPGPTHSDFFRAAGMGEPPARRTAGVQTAAQVVENTWRALGAGRNLVVSGGHNRLLVTLSGVLFKSWSARLAGSVLRRWHARATETA